MWSAIESAYKRMRKESQTSNSIHRRICDYMWSTLIVLRDEVCLYCKRNASTAGHHIFCKKECPGTRYNPQNGIGLCGGCHKWKAHGNPEMYRDINIAHVNRNCKDLHKEYSYDHLKVDAMSQQLFKHDYELMELFLWSELSFYDIFKPAGWDDWKEYKKKDWLRERR